MPSSKPSAQSSFHLQQQQLQELLQNHQQRRGVHQQQEGVRHPHPSTLPDRMQSQNNYPEKRLPSVSNSSSLSATDIKRLNHDLARLRQLLTTGITYNPKSSISLGGKYFSLPIFIIKAVNWNLCLKPQPVTLARGNSARTCFQTNSTRLYTEVVTAILYQELGTPFTLSLPT